jgi:hypothetical protein
MNEFRLRRDGSLVTEMELRVLADGTQLPEVIDAGACEFMQCDPVLASPLPQASLTQRVQRAGAVQDGLGNWVQAWAVVDLDQEEADAALAAEQARIRSEYDALLMDLFNATALARGYRGFDTCYMRAGNPDGPFYAEGKAFADWVEGCNVACYQILAEVAAGAPIPAWDGVLARLPAAPW